MAPARCPIWLVLFCLSPVVHGHGDAESCGSRLDERLGKFETLLRAQDEELQNIRRTLGIAKCKVTFGDL